MAASWAALFSLPALNPKANTEGNPPSHCRSIKTIIVYGWKASHEKEAMMCCESDLNHKGQLYTPSFLYFLLLHVLLSLFQVPSLCLFFFLFLSLEPCSCVATANFNFRNSPRPTWQNQDSTLLVPFSCVP